MQKNKVEIIFTIIGLTIVGTMFYFYYKKNKSFLKMTDSEKNKFLQEEYNKREKIINDPNLTAEEKAKEQERLNKLNLAKFSEAEMKEMAKYNLEKLMKGELNLRDFTIAGGLATTNDLPIGAFPSLFPTT